MSCVNAKRILGQREVVLRLAFIVAVAGILLALRVIDPEASSWFPLRTSCGAITGLPCLFCGTTRAMHHLLNGELGRAFYFNWLAIPILTGAVSLMLMFGVEAALGQRMLQHPITFRLNSRRLAAIGGVVVALWVLQISLAVSLHKHELLNPAGPLYPLFVR